MMEASELDSRVAFKTILTVEEDKKEGLLKICFTDLTSLTIKHKGIEQWRLE